jgi:hypothetical protein
LSRISDPGAATGTPTGAGTVTLGHQTGERKIHAGAGFLFPEQEEYYRRDQSEKKSPTVH